MTRVAKLALVVLVFLGLSAPAFAVIPPDCSVFKVYTADPDTGSFLGPKSNRGICVFFDDGLYWQSWSGQEPVFGTWVQDFDFGVIGCSLGVLPMAGARHGDFQGYYYAWKPAEIPLPPTLIGDGWDDTLNDYVTVIGIYDGDYAVHP